MSAVVTAKNLVRRIGDRAVVSKVDVSLEKREAVCLMGPSGCGKTTLLQILGTLDRPDEGSLRIAGEDPWSIADAARARIRCDRIGFVFQQNNLLDSLTALENVALPAWRKTRNRADAMKKARALLDRFGLTTVAASRASELSGGEAQRVAIARAIVNDPIVVLADEPTGSLDSASANIVMETLLEVSAGGAALLVVTHDADIAARASRSLSMRDGVVQVH